jgi:hypothetical protein
MRTIWKFPLRTTDAQNVEMPAGSQVLSVQTQAGVPCLWALVDPAKEKTTRTFAIVGTGHPLPPQPGVYVGSYQLDGGALVFHVFDVSADVQIRAIVAAL